MSSRVPRILVISEIPTPYRLPLYERLAARPEIELEVVFCSRGEPDRPWELDDALDRVPHRFLRGVSPAIRTRKGRSSTSSIPARWRSPPAAARRRVVRRLRGLRRAGRDARSRAAAHPLPPPQREHARRRRRGFVRLAKRALVGRAVAGAAAGLAAGTEAARYLEHYGLAPERIRIVPNTIDVAAYGQAAAEARARRASSGRLAASPSGYALFAGRLVEDKGILDLISAPRAARRGATCRSSSPARARSRTRCAPRPACFTSASSSPTG